MNTKKDICNSSYTLLKTRIGYKAMLIDFPTWFISGNFILNIHSDCYYCLTDDNGSMKPTEELLLVAKRVYKLLPK